MLELGDRIGWSDWPQLLCLLVVSPEVGLLVNGPKQFYVADSPRLVVGSWTVEVPPTREARKRAVRRGIG